MPDDNNNSVERMEIDPRELLTDVNIRRDVRLDKDFVASIKGLGVLVPIVGLRTANGTVWVRFGHRRTLAAIEAGLATVPVHVVGDERADDAAQIGRIVEQHAENAHRAGLSSVDQVGVVEQLAAFGLSANQIHRRTHIRRRSVDDALAVAQSEVARTAAAHYEFLSLEQAAVVAAFEDDPEAVKALVVAAKTGGFDHVAQRLRDDRERRAAYESAKAALTEAGVALIERPRFGDKATALSQLRHDGQELDESNHAGCPGHGAWLDQGWTHPDRDDAAEDDEGWSLTYVPVYVCADPATYGHTGQLLGRSQGRAEEHGGVDEGEAEARRQERRRVLANNKAWRSAEVVRREWLGRFVTRKTALKGALRFVFAEVVHGDQVLCDAMQNGHRLAAATLGVEADTSPRQAILDALEGAADGRAQVIALAVVLGAVEASLDVYTWRSPTPLSRRYLGAIRDWGYEPSKVEQLVIAGAGS